MKLHLLSRFSPARAIAFLGGRAPLGLFVLGAGLAGCQSQAAHKNQHWTGYYIGPAMSRQFLDYDPETGGDWRDYWHAKGDSIGLTLRRHFFNDNPDNPFQSGGASASNRGNVAPNTLED